MVGAGVGAGEKEGLAKRRPVRYVLRLLIGRADLRLTCQRGHGPGAPLLEPLAGSEKKESREGLTRRGQQVKM